MNTANRGSLPVRSSKPAPFARFRIVVPFACGLVMSLLMLLPIGTGLGGAALPHLTMIAVFYFSARRPGSLPYGACASLGLILDLWLAVPLGLNMLLMVGTRIFVLNQLKYFKGRSRLVHWAFFVFLSFILFLLTYALTSLVQGQFLPLEPLALQWSVTAFSFGPVAFLLGRVRRSFM